MGVKGLFQFLKRFEKDVHIPQYITGKSVGVDIFWFLHQSKGDMFHFQNNLLPIIKHAKKVHCVFDGAPSAEKKKMLEEQSYKRYETIQSIQQIEKFLKYPFNRLTGSDRHYINDYLNQLKRQVWQPPPEYINYVKSWLINKNCEIHQAFDEADEILIELEQKGQITTIITNDSDLLILGSSTVLRPISPLRGAVFDKKYIQEILGFTVQQWDDFMYLCKNMKDKDVVLAYSLISVYKELEYVLQKYYDIYKDKLVSDSVFEKILEIK
jgi:5'-3' exonuclease